MQASRCVAVEVLVQFTPVLPQPFTLLADCGPAEHLAPDPACQLDDRLQPQLKYFDVVNYATAGS